MWGKSSAAIPDPAVVNLHPNPALFLAERDLDGAAPSGCGGGRSR